MIRQIFFPAGVLCLCLAVHTGLSAQDSVTLKTVSQQLSAISKQVQELRPAPTPAATPAGAPAANKPANNQAGGDTLSEFSWCIILMPVALTIGLFSFFLAWLKKEDFKLSDVLSGNDPITLTSKTSTQMTGPALSDEVLAGGRTQGQPVLAAQATIVANSTDVLPKSCSRVIAFLTGITAIICAVSFMTLFIYAHVSKTDTTLNFDGIWKILTGLGVGVVPYGFNQLKESSTAKPSN